MGQPYEGEREDLFDFPEVEGLEEFGLVPPVPEGVDLTEFEKPQGGAPASTEPASTATRTASSETPANAAPDGIAEPESSGTQPVAAEPAPPSQPPTEVHEARANPPVPEGIDDLDEDLFGFDELFVPEDETLQAQVQAQAQAEAQPAPPAAPDPPAEEGARAPAPAQQQDQPAPKPEPADAAGPAQRHEPGRAERTPLAGAAFDVLSADAHAGRGDIPRLARDRGPRLLLPEDVPYSLTGDQGRVIWALVACFLLVNTGIFWLAHQASSNVHTTLTEATGVIANALAQRDRPTFGAAPAALPDAVSHTVETPPGDKSVDEPKTAPEPVVAAPEQPESPVREIDPRDFGSTHEFSVRHAEALLEDGRPEEARHLLNYVLANRDLVPLTPALHEKIDFLIPLTYDRQALMTAPEEPR